LSAVHLELQERFTTSVDCIAIILQTVVFDDSSHLCPVCICKLYTGILRWGLGNSTSFLELSVWAEFDWLGNFRVLVLFTLTWHTSNL